MSNPKRVHAGRVGMAKRWESHIPMTLRLHGLTTEQRIIVVEMVRTLRAGNDMKEYRDA